MVHTPGVKTVSGSLLCSQYRAQTPAPSRYSVGACWWTCCLSDRSKGKGNLKMEPHDCDVPWAPPSVAIPGGQKGRGICLCQEDPFFSRWCELKVKSANKHMRQRSRRSQDAENAHPQVGPATLKHHVCLSVSLYVCVHMDCCALDRFHQSSTNMDLPDI